MPCYSTITTKLTDLEAVKIAAEQEGFNVVHNGQVLRITGANGVDFTVWRSGSEKTLRAQAEERADTDALRKVSKTYAVNKLKAVAKKRGFMVSKGAQPNQYVFTSFR